MSPDPEPGDPIAQPLALELGGTEREPVITAAGEIDVATSPLLRAELAAALAHNPEVITVDLARVSFIDSSGLGVLVGALKRIRESGAEREFRIVHAQDAVRKVFDITGLDSLFQLRS